MSSDREYLVDLLAWAYSTLLRYGVQNSDNMDNVLRMDAIKLELEFNGAADSAPAVEPLCEDCKGYGTRLRPGSLDDADPCPACKGTGLAAFSAEEGLPLWDCAKCGTGNDARDEKCPYCLTPRLTQTVTVKP